MRTGEIAAVSLAVMLVVAGCLGGQGGGTAGAATQAETTTETAAERLPPGVNESGVTNADALVEAHEVALAATGYTYSVRLNESFERDGRTTWTRSVERGTVTAGLAGFRVRSRTVERTGNRSRTFVQDAWANGSFVFVRGAEDDRTRYRRLTRAGAGSGELDAAVTQTIPIRDALRRGVYEVTGVGRRNGRTLTTLTATDFVRLDFLTVTAYESTLVVDDAGRVHELTVALESTDEASSSRQRTAYRFELTSVGPTDVDRPNWLSAARNATAERNR